MVGSAMGGSAVVGSAVAGFAVVGSATVGPATVGSAGMLDAVVCAGKITPSADSRPSSRIMSCI